MHNEKTREDELQVPFDGVVAKCVVEELDRMIVGGRIEKIFQPESDEIILNLRAKGQNLKLLMSASANYPRIHITEWSKENPGTPPMFCMLLRKHLSGARITGIDFHDYERIVTLRIESLSELGDLTQKKLIIEIMGRHSNIILTNSEDKIIDSIKHIDSDISSVREVMPARPYVLPPSQDKISPEKLDIGLFIRQAAQENTNMAVEKYLLNSIKGFSPLLCREVCHRAGIDGRTPLSGIDPKLLDKMGNVLGEMVKSFTAGEFKPCLVFGDAANHRPIDFHCIEIRQYPAANIRFLPSINMVLDCFYSAKDFAARLNQKKSDLQKLLNTNIERCNKKMALQQEKLREVADREKLKLYGELITSNIYSIPKGAEKAVLLNYYSDKEEYVEIALDKNLLPQENAQRYFRQYAKAKSAYEFTSRQLEETMAELNYLESVLQLLEDSGSLQEIDEIREELMEQGYLKQQKKGIRKKQEKSSEPHRFKSSDGLFIYVGKNNRQNDQLTMKTAAANDIWLHAKNIPGSHVIIKKQQGDIPDRTLLEAAMLAAYYSKAKMSSNVPVDYTTVRNVKKPPGSKPGMVIYENYKTITVTPDEEFINKMRNEA